MQKHQHRNELWLFLCGTGFFYRHAENDEGFPKLIKSGCHEFVKPLEWHQYLAIKPTLVLEIQTGLCKEDDIDRLLYK